MSSSQVCNECDWSKPRATRQFRTEAIELRDFVVARNVTNARKTMCYCQEGRQTVQHVLLTCWRLRILRKEYLARFSGRTSLLTILNKHKLATRAIQLIEQTKS